MPNKPAVNLGKTSVPRLPKAVPQRNVRTLDVQDRAVQALSIKVTPVNQPDSAGEATNLDFRVRYNQQSQLTQYSNYTAFDKQADDAANRTLNSANAWGGTGASQYSSQVQTGLKNFGVSSPVQQSYSRALEPETPMFGVNASNYYRSYSEAVQTGSFANARYESDPYQEVQFGVSSRNSYPSYTDAFEAPSYANSYRQTTSNAASAGGAPYSRWTSADVEAFADAYGLSDQPVRMKISSRNPINQSLEMYGPGAGAVGPGTSFGSSASLRMGYASGGLRVRTDYVLSGGGRSGQNVKNLIGPPSSVVRSPGGNRIYVTDAKGRVVRDITRDRVKPVTPGTGFGAKRAPTQSEIDLLKRFGY